MASKDIMEAGAKTSQIIVARRGVAGNDMEYTDVDSWRLGYNGILTIKMGGVTEIHSAEEWLHIKAIK